jgi:hypothetical protein
VNIAGMFGVSWRKDLIDFKDLRFGIDYADFRIMRS